MLNEGGFYPFEVENRVDLESLEEFENYRRPVRGKNKSVSM